MVSVQDFLDVLATYQPLILVMMTVAAVLAILDHAVVWIATLLSRADD